MKRILGAFILVLSLVLSPLSAFAGMIEPSNKYYVGYWPGTDYEGYAVAADACTEGTISGEDVVILSGDDATWEFYLPYASRSVTISYTAATDAAVFLTTDDNTYNQVLLPAGEEVSEKIVFGENLGAETQWRNYSSTVGFLRDYVEHIGEKQITIESDADISIHGLFFEKEKTPVPKYSKQEDADGDGTKETVYYTKEDILEVPDYLAESASTVLLHERANVLIAKGSRRYIDNDDTDLRPYNIKGSMYLPIETLAKALGYYFEEIPEKGYALMRSDTHEVAMIGGVCSETEGLSTGAFVNKDVFLYHDGKTLAAVRYFGELMGKTVGYKDGLVVIDNKHTVDKILNDPASRTYTEVVKSFVGVDENGDSEKEVIERVTKSATFYEYAASKLEPFIQGKTVGKTIYVAPEPEGKDSNSGENRDEPMTLYSAMNSAVAGDTVVLLEGTYRSELCPKNSGLANAPITFKADEGARVLLSAADALGELEHDAKYSNEMGLNIYKTPMTINLGDGRNQIYIDEEMQTEARYPDGPKYLTQTEISNAWGVRGSILKTNSSYSDGKFDGYSTIGQYSDKVDYDTMEGDSLLGFEQDDYWKGGIYVGQFNNAFALVTGKIDSSAGNTITLSEQYRNQRWWWRTWCNQRMIEKKGDGEWEYGMIVGHKNALSEEGEWVRTEDDGGQLYIVMPKDFADEDTKNITIEAKARQRVIDLRGKKYINIIGIDTIGGGITMDGSEMCMLNDMNMKYISHYTLNADARNGYIDIEESPNAHASFYYDNQNPGAPQRGEVGIYVGGTDNIIVNSTIDHSAGSALYITGLYAYIDNNIMNDCGYMGGYVGGIHIDTLPWEDFSVPRGGYAIYNNVVYNTGRACLDFCRNEYLGENHKFVPFIGCDIAYNDFHDANLTALDTGVIYCNGVNATGIERQPTEVHHNYVYKTVKAPDRNPNESGIFWDGDAMGFDTHNNLVFDTGGESFSKYYVRQQSAYNAEAWGRVWNNQEVGHIAVTLEAGRGVADELDAQYFSEDKPFFAGAYTGRSENYLNNYTRIANKEYQMTYRAEVCDNKSENVILDSGYADFNEDGGFIEFNDVDFGDEAKDEMVLTYRCDGNYTYDTIEITITDAGGNAKTYTETLRAQDTRSGEQACTHRVRITPTRGKNKVRISVTDYYSIKLGGFSLYSRTSVFDTEDYTYFAYAADYTTNASTRKDSFRKTSATELGNPLGVEYVDQTQAQRDGSLVVCYENQYIEEGSKYFAMAAGSRAGFRKQRINVYICKAGEEVDYDKNLVAVFTVLNDQFMDFTPLKVPLCDGVEIAAGNYDIYLVPDGYGTCTDDNGNASSRTSNIYYFGFLKEDTTIGTQIQKFGGRYDTELSVDENGDKCSFGTSDILWGDTMHKKLTNATPGTKAVYKDIDVTEECYGIRVSYWATVDERAGQEITIVVKSPDGTEVARGEFTTEKCLTEGAFKEEVVALSSSVPATQIDYSASKDTGYTVELHFGDNAANEGNAVCQIGWIRFEK